MPAGDLHTGCVSHGPPRARAPSDDRLVGTEIYYKDWGTGQPIVFSLATFSDPVGETFKVKRISGDWHAEVKAKPALDLAVQRILFAPGSWSGWHTHPGPVFIQVVSGIMTSYEANDPDCEPIVRTAGQGYLDVGDHAHIARNETTESAENLVVYLVPPGESALRFDAPDPGHCPFTN